MSDTSAEQTKLTEEQSQMKQIEFDFDKTICEVNGRPFIKNPLVFFSQSKSFRLALTVTDNDSWKDDLALAEKMFGTLVISHTENIESEVQVVKDVLKQRMRYPGITEKPDLQKIAKTWIIPNKVFLGPTATELLASPRSALASLNEKLENSTEIVNLLKLELSDGKERSFLYKLFDQDYRPSLIIVRWSNSIDEHHATSICAGHLSNVGQLQICKINDYSLYFYTGAALYDSVQWGEPSLIHPLTEAYTQQTQEFITQYLNNLSLSQKKDDTADAGSA